MGFFSDLFKGKITASPNQPNSPQSQSTNDSNQAIQNLIDNKDKYQNNLVAGDNRNEYQMRMNALRTGQTFHLQIEVEIRSMQVLIIEL